VASGVDGKCLVAPVISLGAISENPYYGFPEIPLSWFPSAQCGYTTPLAACHTQPLTVPEQDRLVRVCAITTLAWLHAIVSASNSSPDFGSARLRPRLPAVSI